MEQVLYRFTLVAAVLSGLFGAAAFAVNAIQGDGDRLAPAVFAVAAPATIIVSFYILRWIIAGRWTAKQ